MDHSARLVQDGGRLHVIINSSAGATDDRRLSHGRGIRLLEIAGVAQPVEAFGVLEEGVNITTLVEPSGRVLGVHPAGKQRHLGHSCGRGVGKYSLGISRGDRGDRVLRVGDGNLACLVRRRLGRERINNGIAGDRVGLGQQGRLRARHGRGGRSGGGRQESEHCILQRGHGQCAMGGRVDHLLPPTLPSLLLSLGLSRHSAGCGRRRGRHAHGRGDVGIEDAGHRWERIGHRKFFVGRLESR
mmetsp:Transcript_36168/g.87298  ORF Transcript_36168/g.87298 Transcript_36168/m.87298 type:complete len:243 (+) Transcript_36168:937-1665(+)